MTTTEDRNGFMSPEEGEIIESPIHERNGLNYQFCVPPDDAHTTDTNTTTSNGGTIPSKRNFTKMTQYFDDDIDSEPPLKRKKVSSTVTNPYPTLTLHSPINPAHHHTNSAQSSHISPNPPSLSPSPSPIYYYTATARQQRSPHIHTKTHNNTRHHSYSRHKNHRNRNGYRYHRPRTRYNKRHYNRKQIRNYRKSPSKSINISPIPQSPEPAAVDLAATTDHELELLKQKAVQSMARLNKNDLNSDGLLKEDDLECCFNSVFLCKSVIYDIVDTVIQKQKEKQATRERAERQEMNKHNLASLRALALQSLRTISPSSTSTQMDTATNTDTVDMDISPDIVDFDEEEHENENGRVEIIKIVNPNVVNNVCNESQIEYRPNGTGNAEINLFAVQSQKLTLILSQIRKKVNERNALTKMARESAEELHKFIDAFNLSENLHYSLNGLISQHIACNNCELNRVKCDMEIAREREKYCKQIKKMKKANNRNKNEAKKKLKPKRRQRNQPVFVRKILLNETINDLDIDGLYWNGDKTEDMDFGINLFEMYNDVKSKKNNDGYKALITAKIETNLLLYYQDHLDCITEKKQKDWQDLDFMKEYTVDELSMLN